MQTPIEITDHAVIRYLERIHGIDMEFFRDCIRAEIRGLEKNFGVTYIEGVSWLFHNNKLISVINGRIVYKDFMANT